MNTIFALIIPVLFILSFLSAIRKKVRVYDAFTDGAKEAIPLVISVFPYLAAVTMLTLLLDVSGVGAWIQSALTPLFSWLGIPQELAPLLIIKPLSGSGSISVLSTLLETYGVDSYISRCACVLYGSSETVFYIGAVYFAGVKNKKLTLALCISLLSYFLSVIVCCTLCKFL